MTTVHVDLENKTKTQTKTQTKTRSTHNAPPANLLSSVCNNAIVYLQAEEIVIRLGFAELCNPFAWLPVCDSRIMQATGNQHCWIVLSLHIVVWRVVSHVFEVLLLVGVAPLFPLSNRQWEIGREH